MSFLNKFQNYRIFSLSLWGAFLLSLLLSCSSTKNLQEEAPLWSQSRPKTDFYYIGIAKIDKHLYPENYRQTAKKIALSDLASEISVKIESNSLLSSHENNNHFSSDYQQYIKTEMNKDLSGFEMVDEYETKQTYQVYYRLSKEKWANIQAQKKKTATDKAYQWYRKASEQKENLNYLVAIQNYLNGLLEIKQYLNEAVFYKIEDKTEPLDYLLKSELMNLLSDMTIDGNSSTITLNSNNRYTNSIGIAIRNKNNDFIKDIPIIATYKKTSIPFQTTILSQDTFVKLDINQVDLHKINPVLKLKIDKSKILKLGAENRRILGFIYNTFNPKTQTIPIKVELPKIYITKNQFQQSPYVYHLVESVASILNKEGFELVDEMSRADLILNIVTHETSNAQSQKYKQIILNYTINVKEQSNKRLVYTQDFPKEKGVDINIDKATEKAYSKASEEFRFQHAHKLIQGILEQ